MYAVKDNGGTSDYFTSAQAPKQRLLENGIIILRH